MGKAGPGGLADLPFFRGKPPAPSVLPVNGLEYLFLVASRFFLRLPQTHTDADAVLDLLKHHSAQLKAGNTRVFVNNY